MKRKIDVVICTNKNLLVLKKLIKQISNQKGKFIIRIIIIHQSTFESPFPIFLKKKHIIYKNIKLQNLSAAKNIGLKISKSNFICFLDDDIFIKKTYFLESFKLLNLKKCDLLFSKINQINTTTPLSKNMGDVDLKINFFNTNCCLSSSMWINLKNSKKIFFDENFGLGARYGSGEETDFIFNYLKKNKIIYYSSKVYIYHPREFSEFKSLKEITNKFISYGEGQGAIFKKNYDQQKLITCYLFLLSLIKSLIATIVYMLIFKNRNVIKYFSLFKGKIIGFINYKKN